MMGQGTTPRDAPSADPAAGTVLDGRYEIRRRIASGGMADVYLGHDLRLDRDVAIKILSRTYASDPSFLSRFKHEAQSAARLVHPHIVSVFDWASTPGQLPYLVLEYVEGPSLKDVVRTRGMLSEREALAVAADVAGALASAHAQGIVHRDVKPENLLVSPRGGVKLTDFGIARSAASTDATQVGSVLGTASYLSPEQVEGRELDGRSDVYSLGLVLYELLTGQVPFRGSSAAAVALQRLTVQPVPPRRVRPEISKQTEAVVLKALARDTGRRYASAEDMRAGLLAALKLAPAAPVSRAAAQPTVALPRPRLARPALGRRVLALPLVLLLVLAGVTVLRTGALARLPRPSVPGAPSIASASGVTVPSLAAMPLAAARQAAAAQGLTLNVTQEPTFDTPAGLVVTQSPDANARASAGSVVDVTVSTGVKVPDVTGRQCADARADLSRRGWTVKPVRWRVGNATDFGKILAQDPSAGTVLPDKGTISVQVIGPVKPC